MARSLAEHHHLEVALQIFHHILVGSCHRLGRNARYSRDDGFYVGRAYNLLAPRRRQELLRCASFVDDVYGLVGQAAVSDVTLGQFRRRAQGLVGVAHGVVLFESGLEALAGFSRSPRWKARSRPILLEASRQGPIFLEYAAKLLVGGGTYALDRRREASTGLMMLEASITPPEAAPAPIRVWISSMKRMAPSCSVSSAMTLFRRFSKSPRYLVPANRRPRVQRVYDATRQSLRHLFFDDLPGYALYNGGLADACFAH